MKHPRSLRTRLLTGVLLCWLLPLLSVMALAGFLLGSDSRMNVPGVPEGNWAWKIPGSSIYEA